MGSRSSRRTPWCMLAATIAVVQGSCGGGVAAPTADAGNAKDVADACVNGATLGGACIAGQISCDKVDACCAGTLVCDPGTQKWKSSGLTCLLCASFSCGPKTCNGGQFCLLRTATDGGVSHECAPMPPACARQWTCGCVKNTPLNCAMTGSCTESNFHVTLSCPGG